MIFAIDPNSETPIFEQLATQVRAGVVAGTVSDGYRLPAARDLAAALDVNLHTVLRAYQVLRDEGLLDLRRGRGAMIIAHRADHYRALKEALDVVRREAAAIGLPLSAVAAMITSKEHR